MATHATALSLYKAQVAWFEQNRLGVRAAWRQLPLGTYRDFKELTEGNVSTATLRRMGHPYARTRGSNARRGVARTYIRRVGARSSKGLAPLLPINKQRGDLNRSVTLWNRSTRIELINDVGFKASTARRSMYAVQPKGTRYVVPRGIWSEVGKRSRARLRAFRDVYVRGRRAA